MKIDMFDLSAELESISNALLCIDRSLGEVSEDVSQSAMYALRTHLNRIADEVGNASDEAATEATGTATDGAKIALFRKG